MVMVVVNEGSSILISPPCNHCMFIRNFDGSTVTLEYTTAAGLACRGANPSRVAFKFQNKENLIVKQCVRFPAIDHV